MNSENASYSDCLLHKQTRSVSYVAQALDVLRSYKKFRQITAEFDSLSKEIKTALHDESNIMTRLRKRIYK